MNARARALFGGIAVSLCLAACGGGGSTVTGAGGGGGTVVPGPGTLSVAPSTLTFAGPGSAPQSFTVTSTLGNVAAPALNTSGCSPVATISTSSATLPATYTVTPTANGNCSFTFDLGHASAAVGVVVGPNGGNSISGTTSTVVLFAGGTAGSVSVSAPAGNFTTDTAACAGIASVTTLSNSGGSALFSVAPVAVGTCQFQVVSGAASFSVGVVVNATPSGPASLSLSSASLDFASVAAAPQQDTLNFSGPVGQVSIDETDCTGGVNGTSKPKIGFLTLNGVAPGAPVSLPASFTITLYGPGTGSPGTCAIVFTPQNGTAATLTITVH